MKLLDNKNRCERIIILSSILLLFAVSLGASQTAASQEVAPTGGTSEGASEGGPTLLNKPFRLVGESMKIQMTEETNEVESLYAETLVSLEMEGLSIFSHILTYDSATQILKAERNDEDRVIVKEKGMTIFCDEFLYNAETEETRPLGNPLWTIVQDNGEIIKINAPETWVETGEDGDKTLYMKGQGSTLESGAFVPQNEKNERNRPTTRVNGKDIELNEENVVRGSSTGSNRNVTPRATERTALPSPD